MVGACGTDWINSPMIVSLPVVTHFDGGARDVKELDNSSKPKRNIMNKMRHKHLLDA